MTGLPLWFVERTLAAEAEPAKKNPSPNDRPGIALIGCGGQGTRDAQNAASWGDVVAVCDVDASHAEASAKKLTVEGKAAPKIFSDFRKVLERADVHTLVNGTPDHWHTLVNLGAARAKKDVYAEKPLTLTIDEGRRLVQAVKKSGIILQTGTQQRSSQRFRLACELVRNARIGKLKSANVWLPAGLREGPFATAPVPAELNWDFWLGQAPKVDYVPMTIPAAR
jgi:predicted dehydrogenase